MWIILLCVYQWHIGWRWWLVWLCGGWRGQRRWNLRRLDEHRRTSGKGERSPPVDHIWTLVVASLYERAKKKIKKNPVAAAEMRCRQTRVLPAGDQTDGGKVLGDTGSCNSGVHVTGALQWHTSNNTCTRSNLPSHFCSTLWNLLNGFSSLKTLRASSST